MKFSSSPGFNSPEYPPPPPPGGGGNAPPPIAFGPTGPRGPEPSGGVKAIGIISIILGSLCSICVCFGAVMNLAQQQQQQPQQQGLPPGMQAFQDDSQKIVKKVQPIAIPAAFINEMMSIFLIVTGIGTLKLARWGRTTGMVYAGLEIARVLVLAAVYAILLLPIFSQFSGGGKALVIAVIILGPVLSSIYPIILLIFYTRPGVKGQFAVGGPPDDRNPYGPPPSGYQEPVSYPGQPTPPPPPGPPQSPYPPPPPPAG